MRLGDRKTRIVLVVLLLVLGFAAYQVGRHFWGVHHYRGALEALERRSFREAAAHVNKALDVWPGDLSVRLLAAQTARRQGDFDDALRQLRVFEQYQGPPVPLALEYRLLRVQRGDPREVSMLLAYCTDTPEAPEAPLVLEAVIEGSLQVMLRAFLKEKESGGREEIVDVTPAQRAVDLWFKQPLSRADEVQGLIWRGHIASLTRDYAKARAHYRAALALAPDHFQARYFLAELLDREAPEEAAAHLQVLRQRDPANRRVLFRLATMRRGLGQVAEARQILDELLDSNPDDVPTLVERGKVALDEGQLEVAERSLRRALQLAPNDPQVNLGLSSCLQIARRMEEAQAYQARFLEIEAQRKRQRDELAQKSKAGRYP